VALFGLIKKQDLYRSVLFERDLSNFAEMLSHTYVIEEIEYAPFLDVIFEDLYCVYLKPV
jgi:hypothetical protein